MRKTLTVTIDTEGRDLGKVFLLREMSASKAERWATRGLMVLARSGVDIGDIKQGMSLSEMAGKGFSVLQRMSYEDAEPLLEEMMTCIEIIPDPARPSVVRALIEDDIEEIGTRLLLRREVFHLITGFSLAAAA